MDQEKKGKITKAAAIFSSTDSEGGENSVLNRPSSPTPRSPLLTRKFPSLKKKLGQALSVDTSARPEKPSFDGSPPLSPVPKRLLFRNKHACSESSLLDWLLRPRCCSCNHRSSDPAVKSQFSLDLCLTLTPLYVDTERESFEIRRSARPATSPLPWACLGQSDYPKWIRDEFRRSFNRPRDRNQLSPRVRFKEPCMDTVGSWAYGEYLMANTFVESGAKLGLSQAKSEDRSRSYTIPNLPYQQTSETCLKDQIICQGISKLSASQPSALDDTISPPPRGTSKHDRHSHNSLRSGRHNTTDICFSDNLLETPVSSEERLDSLPPVAVLRARRPALTPTQSFADSRASSVGSRDSHGEPGDRSPALTQRRRSSVVVIPPMQVCPGDLLVYSQNIVTNAKPPKSPSSFDKHLSPGSPDLVHGSTASLPVSDTSSGETRKKTWSLMKLFDRSSRKETGNLEDQLLTLKTSEFHDESLSRYKVLHWSDIAPVVDDLSESEIKRREAIWEMFQSELVLLLDHLEVLKHVFLEPMKQLQVEGFLMHAAPEKLFGNVDELCSTNYEFCVEFAEIMEKSARDNEQFVSVDRIVALLRKNSMQDLEADRDTAMAFHRYCLNYINALNYLESLRKHDDFNEYEKFCSQDRRCHRLQLTDLLVTPVQHTMKRPLLLREICKHSEKCGYDCTQLKVLLEDTESALRGLDEKISWLKNFERLQAIQRQLVWPSVIDLQDPKIFVPELLKQHLAKQPCEGLILSPRRIIVQEGPLSLLESGKPVEMQVFLFDDMLLLTKKRKTLVKKKSMADQYSIGSWNMIPESSVRFIVYKQPMPLDRIMVHDMSPAEQANPNLRNSLVVLHVSRYQQIISAVTLQAANESLKVIKILWLTKLRFAMDRWRNAHLDFAQMSGDPPTTINHFSTVSEF